MMVSLRDLRDAPWSMRALGCPWSADGDVVFGVGADWLAGLQVVTAIQQSDAFLGVAKPSMGVEQAVCRIRAACHTTSSTLSSGNSDGSLSPPGVTPFVLFISLFE